MQPKQDSNSYCKIAIDGYSSCGKSTLARALAEQLGILYIDSGAMYRAVSFYLLQGNISVDNHEMVVDKLPFSELFFDNKDKKLAIQYEGRYLDAELRSKAVNDIVSEVSTIPQVRNHLVNIQRILSDQHHVVMDGRDISSVVFPNAQIKVFVTAELGVRAQRRYDEQMEKGRPSTMKEIRQNLEKRDFIDSNRQCAPLVQTEDALVLDNSYLDKTQQLEWMMNVINSSSCTFL